MEFYVSVGLIAVAAALSSVMAIPVFKILQLSGYKARGVAAWCKGTAYDVLVRYAALAIMSFITMIIYVTSFSSFEYARYCAVVLYIAFSVVFVVSAAKSGSSDVKYTGRILRLFVANAILMLLLGAGVAVATYASLYCQTLVAALPLAVPFVVIVANAIMTPIEILNNKKYVKRAKTKLRAVSPIVIGVTGSYGKTTAKNLLAAMLAKDFTVLATPSSYNTPMGICKSINGKLDNQKIFIAEMGARYKGDIKELCDITSPKYGIITAVGDMHLQTLGSRSNVADVKFELGRALPQDGLLVLNGYNEDCKALGTRDTACRKIITGDSVAVCDLKFDGSGTSFGLVLNGERYDIKTALLGAHIAELVCACAAVAVECGIAPEQIAAAVADMPVVPHRLQIVPSDSTSVTVIDDAYNANPVGAKNALDVLGCFDGAKVIITPGFVELGAMEKQCNTELGSQIAAVCDYAFFVGSRSKELKRGAIGGGMSEDAIACVKSRDEAVELLSSKVSGKRTVLFENDLPDNIK